MYAPREPAQLSFQPAYSQEQHYRGFSNNSAARPYDQQQPPPRYDSRPIAYDEQRSRPYYDQRPAYDAQQQQQPLRTQPPPYSYESQQRIAPTSTFDRSGGYGVADRYGGGVPISAASLSSSSAGGYDPLRPAAYDARLQPSGSSLPPVQPALSLSSSASSSSSLMGSNNNNFRRDYSQPQQPSSSSFQSTLPQPPPLTQQYQPQQFTLSGERW